MKIIHVTNHFWPSVGGIEKFVLDLCRESKKKGIQTEVVCLDSAHHSAEKLPAAEVVEGIPVTRVPYWDLKYYKLSALPLRKLESGDIIQVHGIGGLLDFVAATKFLHRKPIILSTHGGIFHTRKISGLKKAYFFGLQRLVLRLVDRTIACSRNDFELFRPIAPRLELIENGVDLEPLKGDSENGKRENVFLFVGRLSRNKRIDRLLEAFGMVAEEGTGFELRIVGKDWEGIGKELEKKAGGLGIREKVVFTGEISPKQLVREYQSASFFVSASEYEGFGISTIEAMGAGCIPVVNAIDSFRNFISDQKNGFLVDFSDSRKTAERIREIVGLPRSGIAENARKTAEEFSWNRKILEWERVYKELAQAGNGNGR